MNDQFKPQVQAAVQASYDLASLIMSQAQRATELSVAQQKLALELAQSQAVSVLEVKEPASALQYVQDQVQTAGKHAAGFAATAFELGQEFQTELNAFVEGHFDLQHAAVNKAIQQNLKQAPEGSEAAVAAVKSALDLSNKALAEARKAAKQSADLAQQTLSALKEQAPEAARTTRRR